MQKVLLFLMVWGGSFSLLAQHNDYFGAGHNSGITVTTSHNQNANNDGTKTVDGFVITNDQTLKDASRFLAQATLGYDYEMIQECASMGYEAWIDHQITLPISSVYEVNKDLKAILPEEPENLWGMYQYRTSWWNTALKYPDVLRQRVAFAFSQIFVVSAFGSDFFEDTAYASAYFYDILTRHAFGNYKDLLTEVTTSPSMGLYLNHMNNPKADPANNIHPDENYAREVMQLFSIGLYELNNDGTRKLDINGNFIPTYDNNDIKEFAKIFTGFSDYDPDTPFGGVFDPEDGESAMTFPMTMHEDWHEPGPKYLLNGQVVPAGQTGMQDVNDAMDNLYNHPNIGPFIGKALIQFLVSANPTPAYVNRVANAFNDDGTGTRGNMAAMIKAILLDPEARNCTPLANPTAGKLREPIVRHTNFLKAFNPLPTGNTFGFYATLMEDWQAAVGQTPMYSPSVFNFYLPEFQPNGDIAAANLVAPVFQIHNSSTSIGFINKVYEWNFDNNVLIGEEPVENLVGDVTLDFSDELALTSNPTALVDRLDILLACGQLSPNSKTIIANAVAQAGSAEEKLDLALYLIMMAPEYAVLK